MSSVTELPAKAPVYGTLLGLLNASSHDIVAKLMVGFNQSLEKTISESKWFELKQFLRFYGELVNANVILPSVYCGLLNDLLAALDQPNQLRQRLDCIVYIILATLPWCGKELSQRNSEELDQILKKIEIYMQRRGDVPVLSILKQYNGVKYDAESEDVLAHIWILTEELKRKSWDVNMQHDWCLHFIINLSFLSFSFLLFLNLTFGTTMNSLQLFNTICLDLLYPTILIMSLILHLTQP